MRAILETGYDGFVAQEFIPTWDDKIKALRENGNDIDPPVDVDGRPENLAAEFTTIYINLGEAYLFEEVVFPDRFPVNSSDEDSRRSKAAFKAFE